MNFKNQTLKSMFTSIKWTRNNTVQIFEQAKENKILHFTSTSNKQNKYIFQPLLFQFQCIITTTDAYYRRLTGHRNPSFGIFIDGGTILKKDALTQDRIKKLLQDQLKIVENVLKNFDEKQIEKEIDKILTISNHEYLHQGQMIIAFREAGIELPDRFKKAWAL